MLLGIGDAETVRNDIQEGNFRKIDFLAAIPVGDVKDRLVAARRHPASCLENPLVGRLAACDQLSCMQQLHAHAGGQDPARHVDDMNGDAGHAK